MKQEALGVLTDFLISLLTKPQSFLRDVANFTFKQFCTEVPAASLQNLLKIVQTPNIEANQMLFGEDEDTKLKEGEADDGEDDDYDSEEDDESDESD